jgi:hypothetical protein
MIDDNPAEIKAMVLFKKGESKQARKLQAAFVKEVLESGEDHCSCTVACAYHGNCVKCVITHRGHGDHLPNCFHAMVNRKIASLAELTENTLTAPVKKTRYKSSSIK